MSIEQGGVELTRQGAIAALNFHHPKSNSLPGKVLKAMAGAIKELGEDPTVKVIVLKSEGEKAFCAGASFDELIAIEQFEQGKEFFMGFARVINAMRRCPKFIIGRVQGKAVGGGVGMASAVDYCLATDAAAVKLSELAVGIGPFVVGPAVERKMGASAMNALAINATGWKPAEWVREKGLYTDIYPSIDTLDAAVDALAQKLANSNPEAMRLMKQAFWQGTDHWDQLLEERAEISGKLVLSDFTVNAINKFKSGIPGKR